MKILSILIACLTFSGLVQSKTVQSLDQVVQETKGATGKDFLDSQLAGKELPDTFGSLARDDEQGKNALLAVIAPDVKNVNWGLVAVKPWKGQANRYIATACGYAEPLNSDSKRYDDCGGYSPGNTATRIIIGVLEKTENGWQNVATPYQETFAGNYNKPIPTDSAFALSCLDCTDPNAVVGNLSKLDLAPYQLNENTRAFGVRFNVNESYAGGGRLAEALTLFAIVDGKIKPVFSQDVYQYENIAGDWNPDGTRQHDVDESESIIIIDKKQTNGFNNLIMKTKGEKTKATFVWDAKQQEYEFLKEK